MKSQIEKTTINAPTRKLHAKWTFELPQDIQSVHGLDVEQEIAYILGREMQIETDWAVYSKLIDTTNWIKVDYDGHYDFDDVNAWLNAHIKHGFFALYTHVMFADESKANWFKLRWLA